jgi:flagellar biosynthesis/type III secretory pathway chaperone
MESQKVNELINVLDEEARAYEDILMISKNKTDIIIEGKVSELESVTRLEQSLVLKMGKLETLRETLVSEISKELNINKENMSISEIMKHFDGEQALKLQAHKNSLTDTLKELKNTNELNSKLIKNSLEYINFSVNLLSSASTGENNYQSTGEVSDGKKKTFFDVKL